MQSNRLEGKTALITGATSNIGRAIALAFAQEGARVVATGRDAARGAEVAAATGGHFLAADLDGSSAASQALAAAATERLGHIDILVNNAGIYPRAVGEPVDDAVFDRMFAVNVKAPFFLTAAIAPAMVERGSGAIVNLGSWIARLGVASPLYSSTKGALETLTRAWAAEYGPSGVRVNAISPGVIQPVPEHPMMRGTPAGTVGEPGAVAHAAVYLASDEAAFVHGTVLDVDGGRTAVAVIAA